MKIRVIDHTFSADQFHEYKIEHEADKDELFDIVSRSGGTSEIYEIDTRALDGLKMYVKPFSLKYGSHKLDDAVRTDGTKSFTASLQYDADGRLLFAKAPADFGFFIDNVYIRASTGLDLYLLNINGELAMKIIGEIY